jgi:hypothetical protein
LSIHLDCLLSLIGSFVEFSDTVQGTLGILVLADM